MKFCVDWWTGSWYLSNFILDFLLELIFFRRWGWPLKFSKKISDLWVRETQFVHLQVTKWITLTRTQINSIFYIFNLTSPKERFLNRQHRFDYFYIFHTSLIPLKPKQTSIKQRKFILPRKSPCERHLIKWAQMLTLHYSCCSSITPTNKPYTGIHRFSFIRILFIRIISLIFGDILL